MATDDHGQQTADQERSAKDRGASLVEYALLVALIALVCIVAVLFLGQETSDSLGSNGSSLFAS